VILIYLKRIHYYLKKILAWNKKLEFNWRQQWETEESNSDIWTHVFPFFAYDIAHTCGPDPKVSEKKISFSNEIQKNVP
jgi:alpha-mannosidase II